MIYVAILSINSWKLHTVGQDKQLTCCFTTHLLVHEYLIKSEMRCARQSECVINELK